MKLVTIVAVAFHTCLFCMYGCARVDRRTESRFTSAALLDDARTILFVHSYRVLKGHDTSVGVLDMLAGYHWSVLIDHATIGTYDLTTREQSMVVREDRGPAPFVKGHYRIEHTAGKKAVLHLVPRVDWEKSKYFLVDLALNSMSRLPLADELARHGMSLGWIKHLSPDGTIVFQVGPIGSRRPLRVNQGTQHIWARFPSGEYTHIAQTRHLEDIQDGEVFFWTPNDHVSRAFHLETRAERVVDWSEMRDVQLRRSEANFPRTPPARADVSPDGTAVVLQWRSGDKTKTESIPIDTSLFR